MPPDTLEVLGKNVIGVFEKPLAHISNMNAILSDENIASLLRPPLEVSQVIAVGAGSVGTPAPPTGYEIESIRSQKTITFTAIRVEVHDRSDRETIADSKLPELFTMLVDSLGVGLKAIGTNYDVVFPGAEGHTASELIAAHVLGEKSGRLVPEGMTVTGGNARLVFTSPSATDVTYTLTIEPRGQDMTTQQLFVSGNANIIADQVPEVARLYELLDACRQAVLQVGKVIFTAGG